MGGVSLLIGQLKKISLYTYRQIDKLEAVSKSILFNIHNLSDLATDLKLVQAIQKMFHILLTGKQKYIRSRKCSLLDPWTHKNIIYSVNSTLIQLKQSAPCWDDLWRGEYCRDELWLDGNLIKFRQYLNIQVLIPTIWVSYKNPSFIFSSNIAISTAILSDRVFNQFLNPHFFVLPLVLQRLKTYTE